MIDFFNAEKNTLFFRAGNLIYSCGKKKYIIFRAEKNICLIIHFAQKNSTFFLAGKIFYFLCGKIYYFLCEKNALLFRAEKHIIFCAEKIFYFFVRKNTLFYVRKKYFIFRSEKIYYIFVRKNILQAQYQKAKFLYDSGVMHI